MDDLLFPQRDSRKIHRAIQQRDLLALDQALTCGAVNEPCDGLLPLHFAVLEEWVPGVEAMLRYGANVNAADADGKTALHHAAMIETCGAVGTLLLAHGAMLNAKTRYDSTPLDIARATNNPESIAFFEQRGGLSGRWSIDLFGRGPGGRGYGPYR